jgi:hypothetical protein
MVEACGVVHLTFELFCVFFLLILVSSLPGDPHALDCDSCMHITQAGSAVTKTLVFHTYYSCAGTIVGLCNHSHIPPTQCAFVKVSVSVLTPFITLKSNG